MAELTNSRRRITGVIFLGVALLMLILGFTVLENYLKGLSFIIYWLSCFAFTLSAASVALLDIAMVKARSREEQRRLLEDTLSQVEHDKEQLRKDSLKKLEE